MAIRLLPGQRTLSGGFKWETPPIIEWLSQKSGGKVVTGVTSFVLGSALYPVKNVQQPFKRTQYVKRDMPYGYGYRRRNYRPRFGYRTRRFGRRY